MLKVNDEEIKFTIDTGAEVSVLNTNVAKNIGLNKVANCMFDLAYYTIN